MFAAKKLNNLFYAPTITDGFARLDEEESRHLLTVLRRKVGDRLHLTDGRGFFYEAEIAEASKKYALARILSQQPAPPERPARLHVAMAPVKSGERYEWFFEKAAEIGIDEITPLICQRGERGHLRMDRLEKILVSAMKQSLRATLPKLNPMTPFAQVVQSATETAKFIPWCSDEPLPHLQTLLQPALDTLILIGPEGDFSPEEVALARQHGFAEASLGTVRLRSETAGILVVAAFNLITN